ncbi:hypothetical protein RRG08_050839 [Elysia crispata]|uniref:Uncharacterized protein n=1 Tax=Elysia crispata TaxID=231223 RepID=A0AAE1DXE1_9GAST|nr:hypothetical protein RRG08_050839 [Elysia crispata]
MNLPQGNAPYLFNYTLKPVSNNYLSSSILNSRWCEHAGRCRGSSSFTLRHASRGISALSSNPSVSDHEYEKTGAHKDNSQRNKLSVSVKLTGWRLLSPGQHPH